MNIELLIKRLQRPTGNVDVVLDTDAYNEIDDQYAISYLLSYKERLNTRAIFAAPFHNHHSEGPADGMEKSYNEILNLLTLIKRDDLKKNVYRGSTEYLKDEKTPVESEAARKLCELAMEYDSENPLYVVAIGAITNIASAILMKPEIVDRIVIVWLGGHSLYWPDTNEFNMGQDIAAARIIFGCGAALVQIPCMGMASAFAVSEDELVRWLKGKNALCDYLVQHTVEEVTYAVGKPWTRVLWDVTAIAWLTGDFTHQRLIPSPIPEYDFHYGSSSSRHFISYVYYVARDELMRALFERLGGVI